MRFVRQLLIIGFKLFEKYSNILLYKYLIEYKVLYILKIFH